VHSPLPLFREQKLFKHEGSLPAGTHTVTNIMCCAHYGIHAGSMDVMKGYGLSTLNSNACALFDLDTLLHCRQLFENWLHNFNLV